MTEQVAPKFRFLYITQVQRGITIYGSYKTRNYQTRKILNNVEFMYFSNIKINSISVLRCSRHNAHVGSMRPSSKPTNRSIALFYYS